MEIAGYVASILIGLVLGLLGGGGSILSIPILVYLFHTDVVLASAYSLFVVGVTSLAGAIPKYKDHLVNIKAGLVFGIPSLASIFVTRKWIVPAIPEILWQTVSFTLTKRLLLLGLFAILMILASISMIKGGLKEIEPEDHRSKTFRMMTEGTLIGFLTGLVGAGGGFLIIPALVLLTGLNFKTAVGTSLFIIAINSLTGFVGDVLNYAMNWKLLLTITSLSIVGILIGNYFSKKISGKALRSIFGWFVLVIGCCILIREIFLN
jgi:uncharacterized membrane protein YfcA